jgi:sec-independent protein translocase protein TatC
VYLRSYYLEIKNRSLLLIFTWLSIILVCYIFKEVLLYSITSDLGIDVSYFIFTDIVEVFSAYTLLILFIGNQFLVLYLFYHLLAFTLPGLTIFETNFTIFTFYASVIVFFFSVILFNTFLFPISWDFFLSFKKLDTLKTFSLYFEAKLIEYIMFYIKFYYLCFLYFQIFLFPILLFTRVKYPFYVYKNFRKFLYYLCLIFSTSITPPDIFSQLSLSMFLIIFCEILTYGFALKVSINTFLIRQPIKTD